LETIQKLLNDLQSIKKINITQNKRIDMTIYPAEFYSPQETEEEIIIQLESFFESKPFDSIFKAEKLSEISKRHILKLLKKLINLVVTWKI